MAGSSLSGSPSPAHISLSKRFRAKLRRIARAPSFARIFAIAIALAALFSGLLTYGAMSREGPDPQTVLILLAIDAGLLLLLGAVVAVRLVSVWAERRKGAAGSRLHIRFVLLFSLVAVTPTILMAVFSTLFFNIGVQGWFSDRVQTALMESNAVATAYLQEHQQIIGGDALAMANDLNREGALLLRSPQRLGQIVATQAAVRSLTEAIVFDESGRILAKSGFTFSMELVLDQVPYWARERAKGGEVAVLTDDNDDRVRALVRLEGGLETPAYLFVGRFVDPKVIGHMERTAQAVAEYRKLEGRRSGFEITFSMVYVVVALLLLLAAVWVGLMLATQLARPIAGLINAAEAVRAGDLSARVEELGTDELGTLSRSFNRMTSQLQQQRGDLVEANRELDERRRFTETVLAGVSAGVIGLDHQGKVTLPNRSAVEMLGIEHDDMVGHPVTKIMPEIQEGFETVMRRPERLYQKEISLLRDGRPRSFLVRVAAERLEDEIIGYVLTFDDITELASAQRMAAWADVARRIAHEIKNPLTPIQLSAERLKRKYLKEIESDPATFTSLTDTIVRQVGDIGRMVDEFSAFARMPAPVMRQEDLKELLEQAVFLQRNGSPDVAFDTDLPDHPVTVNCDPRQIGQALTNILKNAIEAIEGRDGDDLPKGTIRITIDCSKQNEVAVIVEDNGKGLPKDERDRLTEPYVTTRLKGTGLGLAIVKKIMEDHGGTIVLSDSDNGGAKIKLTIRTSGSQLPLPQGVAIHGA